MAGQGQDFGYDDQTPNGPVYQDKVERPITRVGSRQKIASASQQQQNGRPGTGRNASSSGRPRPPSPEPSEAGGGHSDDDVHYDEVGHPQLEGTYNPEDYANLNTTPEIKQLFEYITTYLPSANMTPEVKFKPFIREYEASVGDIDAFLKVVHPDITNDGLGIKVLDEPSAFQSDPSVLDLRLRAMAKQSSAKAIVVKKVENAHKNPKIIENWIKDISDLHRSKPSPSVHYSKPMPDIDLLLQEWPPEFEELLKSVTTPTAQLDCDLKTYVDLVCNVLDIPVYKSRIQSLHVLATLYTTHKNFNTYGPAFGPIGSESQQRLAPSASNSLRAEENNIDRMEF